MGQCNPLHLRALTELHHVFNRAMAPADLGWILFGSILRVVDEKIRAVDKFSVSEVLPSDIPPPGSQPTRVGFVITRIHHCYPVGLQAITERERRMIQILGGDF